MTVNRSSHAEYSQTLTIIVNNQSISGESSSQQVRSSCTCVWHSQSEVPKLRLASSRNSCTCHVLFAVLHSTVTDNIQNGWSTTQCHVIKTRAGIVLSTNKIACANCNRYANILYQDLLAYQKTCYGRVSFEKVLYFMYNK